MQDTQLYIKTTFKYLINKLIYQEICLKVIRVFQVMNRESSLQICAKWNELFLETLSKRSQVRF